MITNGKLSEISFNLLIFYYCIQNIHSINKIMKIERLKIRKWKNKIAVKASFYNKMYFNQIHVHLAYSQLDTSR